jgi:hypothetical protein
LACSLGSVLDLRGSVSESAADPRSDVSASSTASNGEMLTDHHYVADWQARDEIDQKPAAHVIARNQLLVDDNDATIVVIGCSKVEANILRAQPHHPRVGSG